MDVRPAVRCIALLGGQILLLGVGLWLRAPSADGQGEVGRYAQQPPLAHTGGLGEPTCQACHFGSGVNEGSGQLTIDGLPAPVRPGQTYELTVTLRASMQRSGFMLALRWPDGTQAGHLTPVDTSRTVVRTVDSTGVEYAHHTQAGTALSGTDRATWTIRWTAPSAADSVVAHAAANAANDDASEFGDDVYTARVRAAVER